MVMEFFLSFFVRAGVVAGRTTAQGIALVLESKGAEAGGGEVPAEDVGVALGRVLLFAAMVRPICQCVWRLMLLVIVFILAFRIHPLPLCIVLKL